MSDRSQRVVAAALAGLAATLPMSVLMLAWHRRLPWWQREPLPPEQITRQAVEHLGLADDLSQEQESALTALNHFGYGAAAGAVYGLLPEALCRSYPLAAGVAYGVGVWAASYLGWLPATGLHRSATGEPAARNLLMLAAHVVWGGSLGAIASLALRRLDRRRAGETVVASVNNPTIAMALNPMPARSIDPNLPPRLGVGSLTKTARSTT